MHQLGQSMVGQMHDFGCFGCGDGNETRLIREQREVADPKTRIGAVDGQVMTVSAWDRRRGSRLAARGARSRRRCRLPAFVGRL
jgi:hypothetical protein